MTNEKLSAGMGLSLASTNDKQKVTALNDGHAADLQRGRLRLAASSATSESRKAPLPVRAFTAAHEFHRVNSDPMHLFSVNAGVPLSYAFDVLTTLLSAGKCAVDGVAAVNGNSGPDGRFTAQFELNVVYELADSMAIGYGIFFKSGLAGDAVTQRREFEQTVKGNKLLSICHGVPLDNAFDQLSAMLGAVISALDGIAVDDSDASPDGRWAGLETLNLAFELVQSMAQGFGLVIASLEGKE